MTCCSPGRVDGLAARRREESRRRSRRQDGDRVLRPGGGRKELPETARREAPKAPGCSTKSVDTHRRSNCSVSLLPLVAILAYSEHGAAEDVKHIRFDLPAAVDGIGVIGSTRLWLGARLTSWFGSGAPARTKRTSLSKSATPVRPEDSIPPAWPSRSWLAPEGSSEWRGKRRRGQ